MRQRNDHANTTTTTTNNNLNLNSYDIRVMQVEMILSLDQRDTSQEGVSIQWFSQSDNSPFMI